MSNAELDKSAIFNRLDELFPDSSAGSNIFSSDSSSSVNQGAALSQARGISSDVSDKNYSRLRSYLNCTSHSKLESLHECPRRYELDELSASATTATAAGEIPDDDFAFQSNIDFAYGHAVGAGIQTYAATSSLIAAQFAAFTAWKAPWDEEKVDGKGRPSGDKSLAWAMYAVEKFQRFWSREMSDWEILELRTIRGGEVTSDPAVEVAFSVDTQNGYFHFGHIDAILIHKTERRLAVWEGKTTASQSVKDAAYANSYQALGYSVVVDAIAKQYDLPSADYEVFYIVYSSEEKEFILMPFTKSLSQRAEWLQDLLLDHAMIDKYRELEFFPKRGASCINRYGRQCQWFGTCQMRNSSLFPKAELQELENASDLKVVNFHFSLDQLVAAQRERS